MRVGRARSSRSVGCALSSEAAELDVIFEAHPKQEAFAEAVLSGDYRFLLFGGGIRSGKTYVGLALLFALCRIFPGSRWAIVRQDLPTLRRNVLPTFNKLRPQSFIGAVNQSDWTATCTNGSQIVFFTESITDDPDLDRWKGLEVNGFLLEEANELQEVSFHKAKERAGSWIIPSLPVQPLPLILLTCNPSPGWIKTIFYDQWKAGTLAAPYYFQPATIADNPDIPLEYRENLKHLPADQYARFVEGDWSGVDSDRLFPELRDDLHRDLRPAPKKGSRREVVADWGWTAPAPALWIETFADGRCHAYREWWPTRTLPAEWAKEVLLTSAEFDAESNVIGYEIEKVTLDSAAWAQGQDGTPSVAEQMLPIFRAADVRLVPSNKGPGSLKLSTMLLHTYFWTGHPLGQYMPWLTVGYCPLLWAELTTIRRGNPSVHINEDVDVEAPHQANHGTAALRYFAMSRPKPAEEDRPVRIPADEHEAASLEAIYIERAEKARVPLGKVRDLDKPKRSKNKPWLNRGRM